MKILFRIFFIGCFSSSLLLRAMSLEEAETRFNEQIQSVQADQQEKEQELRKMYLQALLRYESSAKRQGDLDGLQAAHSEINRVESESGLSTAPVRGPQELQHLAGVVNGKLEEFAKESAEKITAMVESVAPYAETMAAEMTRQGSIEEALAWRTWGRNLEDRPEVKEAFAVAGRSARAGTENREPSAEAPALFRQRPAKVISTKAIEFPRSPALYQAGMEPDGDEKRITSNTPSAQGAGNSLMQVRIKLIEEDTTLREYDGVGYDYKHKEYLYAARMEFTPLPGKSLDTSLVVFDLYKRGTGSKRGIIRTEGLVIPPLEFGTRWVVDSGSYTYETREYDSRWSGWDSESATADEFYGYIVSIFDQEGNLLVQRASERMLGEYARTSPPDDFDDPQSEDEYREFRPR